LPLKEVPEALATVPEKELLEDQLRVPVKSKFVLVIAVALNPVVVLTDEVLAVTNAIDLLA
jgi:hypothetical protein